MSPFRRFAGVVLVCCICVAAGVSAIDVVSKDVSNVSSRGFASSLALGRDPLSVPEVEQIDGGQQTRDRLLAERANPEAALARIRSRTSYERMDAAAAVRLANQALPAVVAPAPNGLDHAPAGVRAVHFLSSTAARVTLPGGQHGVVESLTPIATPSSGGGYVPLDLSLRETGSGFAPAHSEAEVSIPGALQDGAELAGGVSLTAVDASGQPLRAQGMPDGATVFYANTATDTDTAIKATPTGFETYDLLRSVQSPQELSFKIGLPSGAHVEPVAKGSDAVRVVIGDRAVAVVPAPVATDAAGASVPVSTTLSGDTLHLSVAHSGGDFAYPIAVDPTVIDSELVGQLFIPTNWRLEKGGEFEGENFWGYNEGGAGWVMYTDSAHKVNQWGALIYPTQGESHIYEVSMESSAADSTAGVENHIAIFGRKGTEEPTWEARNGMPTSYGRTGATVCIKSGCPSSEGSAGNVAGYWINAIGEGTGGEVRVYTASVYIAQTNGPTASFDTTDEGTSGDPNVLYGAGSWLGPHHGWLEAIGKDPGVGVREFLYEVGAVKWTRKNFNPCAVQCPPTEEQFSNYTITDGANHEAPPDGEPTLTVKAVNGMGTVSTAASTKLKVDGTAPYELTVSGLPSGNSITDANRTVKIVGKAKDGSGTTPSSGIASLKLLIDGKEVGSPSGSCSPGPCTATGEWTIAGEEYAAGTHTAALTATDAAENKTTGGEITFTVHHASPMDIGPGQVNPVNGEFDLEETDVSVPTADTSLRITRAYNSREPEGGSEGPLGSPWTISFGGAQSLVELPNGSVMLVDVGGHRTVFTNTGSGSYKSPEGDTNLVLTKTGSEFKLANKGTTVGFTHTSGDVEGLYRPAIATDTGGTSSTLYTYQVVGGVTEPVEALAPVPTGVSCAPELKQGCRALTFNYASSTTATGEAPSQWGDYNGHLTRVYFTAYDPASKTMKTSTVAQYSYDSKGRLRAEWDPRVSPALKATFGYDAEGHLTTVSPAGGQPWIFTYGTSANDPTPGRLIALTRPPASTELGTGTAPANTAAPKLSGSPVVGVRMAVSDGTWSGAPLSYSYQWESCSASGTECQPIAGATNPNYTPASADVGHDLFAQVTAVNSGGAVTVSTTASSPVTATAQLAPPSVTLAVDPGNSVNAVSCLPNSTTCVVSDSKGNAFYATNVSNSANATWNSWTGPGTSPSEAVTCATTTMCLMAAGNASGYGGKLYYATSLGGAWTLAYSPTWGVDAITCVSATFCVDGQDGSGGFRYSTNPPSTSWTVESQGTAAMKAVSCLSTSFCAIADSVGNVHVATSTAQIESSGWTSTNVDGTTALNGIACTSTTRCLAVDSAGTQLTLTISGTGAATVSVKHNIDAANRLNAITCTGSTCVTVDEEGNVFVSINAGNTWTEPFQIGESLTSVSCASSSLCVTADAAGNVTAFDPTFTQSVSSSSVNAASCVSGTTTCVVSDSKGSAFYATNVSTNSSVTWKTWTGPGTSPSQAVACPTTTTCLMAAGTIGSKGGNLYYATSLGGAWTLAFAPSFGVDSVGCASSTFCVAGQEGGYFRYSTKPASTAWTSELQGSAATKGVSCISSSFCAMADNAGNVHVATSTAQIESSTWTITNVDGTAALNGIACISTTSCLAVDGSGNVLSLAIAGNGTATATKHDIAETLPLTGIACPSSSRCVATDLGGRAFVSTDGGATWTQVNQFGDLLGNLSCASASLCVTGGLLGTVTSFNPAVGVTHEGELRSPTQRKTIEYGVPVSGAGAPYAMSSSEVAKWAQTDVPAEATAIFPPDEPMGWPASDYRRASVYYLDGSDRIVNVIRPGGGIATSEYNSYGDEVRSLSPANRVAALKEGAKSAEVSQTLDTQSTYGSEGTELLEVLGPLHTVKLANGTQVQARHHTVYSYDEGAPSTGGPYRLVTKVTQGAQIAGEPEADVRTTKTAYAGQNNLGWILHAPTSVTVDPTGLKLTTTTVYDPTTGDVTETRTPGAGTPNEELLSGYFYRSTFGSLGSGNGQLSKPGAITKDSSGNLWVADTANNRVEEFSSGGTFVRKFGTVGTGIGQLKSPEGLTIDDKGNVWVADTGNNRIEEFSSTGAYMFQFKSPLEHTEFKGPSGIAFSPQSKKLVIADTGNNRIVAFTLEGLYSATYASSGTGNGQVSKPEGVTIDAGGDIWVADTADNRVEEFSSEGVYGFKWGTVGSGNGQLSKPKGLVVNSEYDVLVADSGNSRIEEFSPFGGYMTAFGTSGSGEKNMSSPAGLVLDASNNAYVLDTGNSRIQNWTAAPNFHESSGTGGTYGKQTVYYSTAANSQVPVCGEHPEWAGLPCQTKPAAQPETSGVPNLPVTTLTYNMWDDVLTSTEAVGSTTRTSTDTYDEAGRILTESVSSTVGTPLPTITYEYNAETGALVKESTTVEGVTKSLEKVYDKRGEVVSYKDADGNTSTTGYDIDGRPESFNDGKGTQTYTYGTTTGRLTELADSAAGTFTATYDAEGNLTSAGYPNGMNVKYTFNSEGEETAVEYVKTTNCSSNCVWYSETEVPSIHGQALSQSSTFSSQVFTYDQAGRLTKTQDTPAGAGCTTRIYAYDVETNLTSLTTRAPGGEGQCATEGGTVVNHGYDTANRLTDAGIAYGTFGDVTTLPAGDAGGSQVTSSYYVDNTLANQTQNGQTIGYSLDPEGRTRQIVSTGTVNSTVTSHYAGDSRSVAWTEDTGGKWTRNIYGLGAGLVAVQNNGETPVLQVEDLHGNLVATMPLSQTGSGLLTKNDITEYGVPRTSSPPKYSWLGSEAVATELSSGIIAMGARSYVPQIGRFLQPDPVEGGSANAYAYTFGDPVNTSDPSGEYMVETPEWVHEFLDEQAEIATEEAIQRAAEEQAAREEAEEKAAEAAAEAAEAAAEAAAAGGGGRHGHHAGHHHSAHGGGRIRPLLYTGGRGHLCKEKCKEKRREKREVKRHKRVKKRVEAKEEQKEDEREEDEAAEAAREGSEAALKASEREIKEEEGMGGF